VKKEDEDDRQTGKMSTEAIDNRQKEKGENEVKQLF
jgi:hypothetical protein